jgi:hypothetical protein
MRARQRVCGWPTQSQRRQSFRQPDGDWLEPRTLLAPTPLGSAVPLPFGLLDDASESRFLANPSEVDLYSMHLDSSQEAFISIDAQQAGTALSSLLRVFDSDGTPLALDNQEGGDPRLTFQAAIAATYYIGVSAAPNRDYDPLVAGSGTPGGTTGLYTLNVRLASASPMPDLTGSSFRTAIDMAAPGDTVPINFTVENRGGAGPGDFQVQVLLAPTNLFDSSAMVLTTLTRTELVTDSTGRSFSSPEGFSVTLPAGYPSGRACLGVRIVADPAVPEVGLFDKRGVHRGSDWEFVTVVTAGAAGVSDLSAVSGSLDTETAGTVTSASPVSTFRFTVTTAQDVGQFKAEVRATSGTLLPRLTLSSSSGQVLIQSDSGQIVQSLVTGLYFLSVSNQTGAGGFRLTTAFIPTSSPFAPLVDGTGTAWVATGDLNGDGIPDIVVANRVADTVEAFMGLGDGTFELPQIYAAGARTWTVTLADATGNGKLDILTVNKGANSISILLNHGDGTFGPQTVIPVGSRPSGVVVADLSGDGIPDLIVNNYASETIEVIPGDGGGTFGTPTLYPTNEDGGFTGPVTPVIADLTGDGIPDLIYPDYVARDVGVRLGNGNGTFGPLHTFRVGAGAHAVAVLDANADGIPDLAVANAVDNSVSVLLGNGDGTFQPERVYPVGFDPYSMTVADLNGDGKSDIVTADRGDNTISVLLGRGDGTFSAHQAYPTGSAPRGIAAADFNGDGKIDIVTANQSDGTATISWGDGDGTFARGAEQSAPAPTLRPFQVVVADVNGDGIPDIVTANRSDNSVSVLLGNRDGSFQTKQTFPTGRLPISVAVADLQGDGVPDIVTANYGGSTVSVLRGNGNGTFQPYHDIPVGSDPYDVKVADLRGDGKEDIVVTNKNDNTVGVLLGNGDGTFQPMVAYPVASGPYEVVVDDLTGNGIPDLVVSHFSATVVDVLLGNGDGSFQTAREFPVGSRPYGLAVADLAGDGLSDIVTSNYRDNDVSVLLNEGNGNFGPPSIYPVGKGPNEVQVADVNGDGRADIITANYGSGDISVLLNNGNGSFRPEHNFSAGTGPASLALADLSGNGKLDAVVGNRNSSTVSVLYGNGDGTFQPPLTIGAGLKRYSVAVAELTGDDVPDVVTTSLLDDTVTVQLGNGDGTFGPGQAFPVGPAPTEVAVADLNGDGRPDLAIANSGGNSVSVLLGNGDGTFTVERTFAVGESPRALAVADLNGDGIPDLVVANYQDDTVSLLLGDGDGTFAPQEVFAVGEKPYSVALADLTGDGRDDIVVANSASDSVSVLFNQGEKRGEVDFSPPITLAAGGRPLAVAVADLLGDGTPDIITANASSSTVSVLIGNDNGTFQPAQTFAVGSRPYSVAAADLTGDGRLDIVTTDYSANSVSVLLNQGGGTFTSGQAIATDLRPVLAVVADVNGDGRPDLVTVSNQDSAIGVLLGKGDGTFEPVPAGTGVGLTDTPLLADFNGDGIADSVVLDRSGEILFRAGIKGALGSFAPSIVLNPGRPARAIAAIHSGAGYAIAAADTHFDPTLSSSYFIFTVSIYTVSASGHVSRRTALETTALPTSLAVAGFTGNGLDDLIAANALDDSVTIAVQVAPDQFSAPLTVPAGTAPSDIAVADLTGNGLLDIIVSDQGSGDVTVILNDPEHTFSRTLRFRASTGLYGLDTQAGKPSVSSFAQAVGLVAGDFTGSRREDLVVVNQNAHNFTVLTGDGTGGFTDPSTALATSSSDGSQINLRPGAVVAGDFNRDGNLDLAVLMEDTGAIWIYSGKGDGTFRHTFSIPVGAEATGLTVVPGAEPGLFDLLAGNGYGDVLILLGKGDGTFQIRGSRVSLSVVPDLLGAGRAGVLVGNQQENRVTIQVPSSGGDRYNAVQTLGSSSSASEQLAPGDVDWAFLDRSSALPDAIVVGTGENAVVVYRTLSVSGGVPTFAPPRTYFAGTAPAGLTAADLNGDGIPDLLIADQGSNDISVVFGSYNSRGEWVGIPGPRLKSGGEGPIAVAVQDLNGNRIPDLAVFNAGSGTVTELPGVGNGFFDDRQPLTLLNFGGALLQPPTFVGTTGLGYEVIAGGILVSFNLFSPGLGTPVVYSGQQVVAAQALANGQVVAALADGAVDLLRPQGSGLVLDSVLQAQGGVPALPSAIDVVSKGGGQFNVLVSSEGSDQLFVFTQVASTFEGGGALPEGSSSPSLNSAQTPALASGSPGLSFTASAITTSASTSATSSSSSASTSASTSSSSASVAAATTVGLSLGTFSSLGKSSELGNAAAVLVAVEGNTYLNVPILEFGSVGDGEEGAGESRMPELSRKYNFGDTSPLTRFVIGLDEALEDYRGLDGSFGSRGTGAVHDPWGEDLFIPHLPVQPQGTGARQGDPEATGRGAGTQTRPFTAPSPVPDAGAAARNEPRGVRVLFRDGGPDASLLGRSIPESRAFDRAVSLAGLLIAARSWPTTPSLVSRRTKIFRGNVAAAKRGCHN